MRTFWTLVVALVGVARAAPASAQVSYHGRDLIQHAKVWAVFWTPFVSSEIKTNIGPFYDSITNSGYMDWLTEYNKPGQSPADGYQRGVFMGSRAIVPINWSTSLHDADIQDELEHQIQIGALPVPDPDLSTIFMIHFPSGYQVITNDGKSPCSSDICAWHNSGGTHLEQRYTYAVIPDMGGSSCDLHCGGNTVMYRTTMAASHELMEIVTDPFDAGWYGDTPTHGEIGDLCQSQQIDIQAAEGSSVVWSYNVQRQWSNFFNGCIGGYRHLEPGWQRSAAQLGGTNGPLAVGLDYPGNLNVVTINSSGNVLVRRQPWTQGWLNLGGTRSFTSTLSGQPTIALRAPDASGYRWLQIFASDGYYIYESHETAIDAWTPFNYAWSPLPNGPYPTAPAIGQDPQDQRLELFAVAGDGLVHWNYQVGSPPGHWNGWVPFAPLPGGAKGQPAVGVNSDGRLEVFVRAGDGSLWHTWKTCVGCNWSNWTPLGGVLTTDPAVAINTDGRLEVFGRGTDWGLWHIWQMSAGSSSWSRWSSLGGYLTSTPAATTNANGTINVFVRGGEGHMWHRYETADNHYWSDWLDLGGIVDGSVLGNLSAARNADGRIEVFYRQSDLSAASLWQLTAWVYAWP
jgi:hypothetical protein